MERRSPEYVEDVLAKRIRHREDEIRRLEEDTTRNAERLKSRNEELRKLKIKLDAATTYETALANYEDDATNGQYTFHSDLEIEVLGEIFVDSGQLLITDPGYINSQWDAGVEFEDIRIYEHHETGRTYQYKKDFQNYGEVIPAMGQSMNELEETSKVTRINTERELSFDYAGACSASMSEKGYGVLKFKMGHPGAGISFSTVHGDGGYLVMGEIHDGRVIRVFVDLQ